MGGKRPHHPRRGSIAYHPRKRAHKQRARVRARPELAESIKIGNFPCYKAGTTHVEVVDDRPNSLTNKQNIATAATVLEAPPLKVFGIKAYTSGYGGLKTLTQVLSKDLDKELSRVFPLPKKETGDLKKIEDQIDSVVDIRLLIHTQPKSVKSLPKKKPEVMEISLSGSTAQEKLALAKELLNSEIKLSDILSEGSYVDTQSITTGKGFQGALKKWGTKHLSRKTRKGRRTAGNLGPFTPGATMWTIPQSGQMGYHQRTEYNKRILKIGADGAEITPDGGFINYGEVRNEYIILKGSVPGPKKRMILLRPSIRPPFKAQTASPEITYINTESMQGV